MNEILDSFRESRKVVFVNSSPSPGVSIFYSYYVVECFCGAHFTRFSIRTFQCPNCKAELVMGFKNKEDLVVFRSDE